MSKTISEHDMHSHSQTDHNEPCHWNKQTVTDMQLLDDSKHEVTSSRCHKSVQSESFIPPWLFCGQRWTPMSTSEFLNPSSIPAWSRKTFPCWVCPMGYGSLSITVTHSTDACGIPHQLQQSKMSPHIAKCPQGEKTASTREPLI